MIFKIDRKTRKTLDKAFQEVSFVSFQMNGVYIVLKKDNKMTIETYNFGSNLREGICTYFLENKDAFGTHPALHYQKETEKNIIKVFKEMKKEINKNLKKFIWQAQEEVLLNSKKEVYYDKKA